MFSFDGDYRRTPIQNLGGASQNSDRDTLIRKAQQERQKRAELRRQNDGATVIQSYARSFILRQRIKEQQRRMFDDFVTKKGALHDATLEHVLKRILFFYYYKSKRDGERLIYLSQYIIKNPKFILTNAIAEPIWKYRLKKLLFFCTQQICVQNLSQTIPFRMLETFTSEHQVNRYIIDSSVVRTFLEDIYTYLVKRKYFKLVRQMLDEKVPPLDGTILHAPNSISETLLQMIVHPLKLVSTCPGCSQHILSSFIEQIIAPEFSEPIKYFVLPCLANDPQFPFLEFIKYLGRIIYSNTTEVSQAGQMDIDHVTTPSIVISSTPTVNGNTGMYTSSFLLNALLTLDRLHLDKLSEVEYLAVYIRIIASMSSNLNRLQRKTNNRSSTAVLKDEDSNDSGSDSDEDRIAENNCTQVEMDALLEVVIQLNDMTRAKLIVENVELHFLEDPEVLHCLCKICHHLMLYNRVAIFEYKLLWMLYLKPKFIRTLWFTLTSQSSQLGFSSPLNLLSRGIYIPQNDIKSVIPVLATFCALFGRLISTLHDGEFCQEDVLPGAISKIMPFTLLEIAGVSTVLKDISLGLVELAFPETRSSINEHYRAVLRFSNNGQAEDTFNKIMWPHLLKVCVSLLRQLHTRDLRRGFCPDNHWTVQTLNLPLDKPSDLHLRRGQRGPRPFQPIKDFTKEDFESGGPPLSTKQIRSITILREIPFVVPFNTRVGILQGLLSSDKLSAQGDLQGFLQGPSIQLTVRRSHIYEDAFDKLRPENEPDLRPRFRVQMINNIGLEEVGIDGGGVFREFLSELIKTAFDPNRGFFLITTDNKLYPNPSVGMIVENFQKHYYFIGRMLGKALYENLLVELPLAEFFLSKLAGKHSDVDVHQLASLDPVLHHNLLSLKSYEGDVADLGLDFTVVSNELGETKVEELKPNGVNIMVNSSNRIEYIRLMADYKLNRQIRQQCAAFRRGLSNVVTVEWLYMFSNKEFQVLISGAEIPVDIDDLRKHARYGGDFDPNHPTIKIFWECLKNFDDLQRRQLLKFVTSCSRPPLLGFKDLDPPFCIQNAGDTDRLPSASTCMNLLKLPAFNTAEQLREKLLYAIESGSGFELS